MKNWTERVHQSWKEQEFNLLGKAPAPAPHKKGPVDKWQDTQDDIQVLSADDRLNC